MKIRPEHATFLALLDALFARITTDGSPEARAWDIVTAWIEDLRNPELLGYLEWGANHGFDDRADRAMFSMSPHDIAVLLNGDVKARKAVLDALEKRLESEAAADINWQDHLRDPEG